jgi:phage terminase large subunit-like protein
MGLSLAERFAQELTPIEQKAWVESLSPQLLKEVARGEWWWTARPEQIPPPGDWSLCLILAGRGFGKSKLASEWIVQRVIDHPTDRHGFRTEWLVIAETLSDARTISIEGPSGILRVLDRREYTRVERGKLGPKDYKYVKHPKPQILIGEAETVIFFEGADSADVGRGYNAAGAVLDEVAKWKKPKESWFEGIMPSLRADLVGDHPRTLIATTPKPIDLLREWVQRTDGSVTLIRGSTFDNAANLSAYTLDELDRRYHGTSIGRQELYGELLDARDGMLFAYGDIDRNRVESVDDIEFTHVTVGVDPTLTEEGDLMGVVIVGRSTDNHMYVLGDESVPLTSREAARHIWRVFWKHGADTVVIEENLAKRWMIDVLNDAYVELRDQDRLFPTGTSAPLKRVDSRVGKKLRAEPVAMRYEQNTVHHLGTFSALEEEMLNFDPTDSHNSPNRMDAMVHAARHLMAGEKKRIRLIDPAALWVPTR